MARLPAVAGRFYPDDPVALLEEVQRHLEQDIPKVSAQGVIAPHAGFKYSGDVAGTVYSRASICTVSPWRRIVLLVIGPMEATFTF